jgi:transcriptional regulator with XRE-family HTH domain
MNTNSRKEQLTKKLKNKKYREAFVASHLSTNIASQIIALREKKQWKQADLAEKVGMAQPRICLLEDPNYQKFSITTLKRLAAAFDVALIVRFVSYGELLSWAVNLSPDKLAVPSFEEELTDNIKPLNISEAQITSLRHKDDEILVQNRKALQSFNPQPSLRGQVPSPFGSIELGL